MRNAWVGGGGGADMAQSVFTNYVKSADTARRVRWFYVKAHPVGNVPPERFQNIGTVNGTQGRSGLVRSALEKLSLFSPTFSVRQKYGAGNFAVCGQRLRGHVPSKNTSPAALSWSSLMGSTNSFLSVSAQKYWNFLYRYRRPSIFVV